MKNPAHHLAAFSAVGPGLVIAATGLGAGDLVAATVSGAELGVTIAWAVVVGAVIKFVLNEGLARWQLASGSTLLSGWVEHLPRWVRYYFFAYLCVWSLLVGAALMAACGLAGHALMPSVSISGWAALHSFAALLMVWRGNYRRLETVMKVLIAAMFVVVMAALWKIDTSELGLIRALLSPQLPDGHLPLLLAVVGGVGGSVTLLCYGYWIREKGWQGPEQLARARIDLAVGYLVTGMFGIGIMVLAASAAPPSVSGTKIIVALADELAVLLGEEFRLIFLLGFWAAVFSSMLGVWQGIPYLFADLLAQHQGEPDREISQQAQGYTPALLFLAGPPLLLLLLGKPVWLVLLYSVAGAFFMPFLAATLLYLNNRCIPAPMANSPWSNAAMILALLLFSGIGVQQLFR
ncbi:Nramp family divalent metal transporter [Spongiibacter sp. KMU-166]|uniref:Nramp family divalent metal transporter n=1 Tax=Spongiibacter thalassae TaxID=2721624 RepID=A0ABX1GAY6_9GAMM|nr:Nramp family divalent metal transporter [Spongiibacter thalassae]NKI16326.1 Nramp family divalent metal transporter [Spongiibacter thalassae]